MASGIAHDFNNALAVILGYSELLLHRPGVLADQEKATRYLKMMNTAAQDAGNVVNRLREFYRFRDAGEVFAPVDINQLVTSAVGLTKPKWQAQAQASGRTIEVKTAPGTVPLVAGNESELREALTNLIINAVDAMPHGGTITLRTFTDGPLVCLAVTDTGTGMTEETRRRCLEPFFSTKGASGTGLGLSMVYGTVVQRHQGTIDIETARGAAPRSSSSCRPPTPPPDRPFPRQPPPVPVPCACWSWMTSKWSATSSPKCWSAKATPWSPPRMANKASKSFNAASSTW
jgi:signal transduction histidine kinase